jgi:hypothetical protein
MQKLEIIKNLKRVGKLSKNHRESGPHEARSRILSNGQYEGIFQIR